MYWKHNLYEIKLESFFCKLILKTTFKCFRILQPKAISNL